jgi:signal peptidase II
MVSVTAEKVRPWALIPLAVIVAVDQLTKWLVVENLDPSTAYPVIGDVARLYLIRNSGAAFSMGENATIVFSVLQMIAVVVCAVLAFRVRSPWAVASVAMIGGGAAGNLIDRIFRAPGNLHGHVVDFISVGDFAIFNVADASITVGVITYLVYALLIEPKQQRKAEAEAEADETA